MSGNIKLKQTSADLTFERFIDSSCLRHSNYQSRCEKLKESPWPDPLYKVCKSSCTRKKKSSSKFIPHTCCRVEMCPSLQYGQATLNLIDFVFLTANAPLTIMHSTQACDHFSATFRSHTPARPRSHLLLFCTW